MNNSQATSRRLGSRGTSAAETALFAAVLGGVALCGVDIVNYARTRLKLDEATNNVASLVSGYQQLYLDDFQTFYQLAQQSAGSTNVTGPATLGPGATILTGITNTNGTSMVAWRQQSGGTASSSSIGAVGTAAKLPDNYVVPLNSSVVAVEVIGAVSPWVLSKGWMGTSGPSTLSSITIFQPRAALLSQITSGSRS